MAMGRNSLIKVLTVFGTRPEAIKLAPVVREIESRPDLFSGTVCVTAQHRGMLDQVLEHFGIEPDFDLDLMSSHQSTTRVASTVLDRLPEILTSCKPDVLMVQGDTMTTFSAALAAYLNRVPVGHVEAGLRTGNFDHPFPEEMNRCLTTRLATMHFAPTTVARDFLLAENVDQSNIFVTGNTVIDALLGSVDPEFEFMDDRLASLGRDRPLVLVTTHRRESFGEPMQSICAAIADLASIKPKYDFVIPVHPNPDVASVVRAALGEISNVRLVEPLGYKEFTNLMARSRLILTDSGGIQEEAPALDIPVLVLRETTERPEGIAAGSSRLVGTDRTNIVNEAIRLLDDETAYGEMAAAPNPYGDGTASKQILDALLRSKAVLRGGR